MKRALRYAVPVLVALAPIPGSMAEAQQSGWRSATQDRQDPTGRPGWLGLAYDVRWVHHGGACEPQVVVESVIDGAPADRAGVRQGDVIVAMDGRAINGDPLPFGATPPAPGDSVRLRVSRTDGVRDILAVADLRPTRPPVTLSRPMDGFSASDLPVVTFAGDTVVARNLESHQLQWGRGYWLAHPDGRAEYRRLDRFATGDVDRRVVALLQCADETVLAAAPDARGPAARTSSRAPAPASARAPAPPPAPPMQPAIEQLHRRADSLRFVIARRAMARDVPGATMVFERTANPERGVAGAQLVSLEPDLAEYFRGVRDGLLVTRVAPGTPAARAGLRAGDVITEGGGRRIDALADLQRLLARPDAARLELRVVRKGRSRLITLRQE